MALEFFSHDRSHIGMISHICLYFLSGQTGGALHGVRGVRATARREADAGHGLRGVPHLPEHDGPDAAPGETEGGGGRRVDVLGMKFALLLVPVGHPFPQSLRRALLPHGHLRLHPLRALRPRTRRSTPRPLQGELLLRHHHLVGLLYKSVRTYVVRWMRIIYYVLYKNCSFRFSIDGYVKLGKYFLLPTNVQITGKFSSY